MLKLVLKPVLKFVLKLLRNWCLLLSLFLAKPAKIVDTVPGKAS